MTTKSLSFHVEATREDDVKVPVGVTIEYPSGMGMSAVNAVMAAFADDNITNELVVQLLDRGDAETIARLAAWNGGGDDED